ncbi:MAG: nickel pincer cofactor biosynthesis protein LarC [Nitrospinota bacterium]|nr:nickel pincer cofactor biosynthesis protein LarC [Nitrospinota bacterium]
MKIAYFDAFSGVSGDMTLGAMLDAGLPLATLQSQLAKLPVAGYTLTAEKVKRCGLAATKAHVHLEENAHGGHRHLSQILKMIDGSGLDARVKDIAGRIFTTLGQAEAAIHGVPLEKVHFHEVGAVDSIVDIVGAAIGFCELDIGEVAVSAINTGHGAVQTEHGLLPVPAPATAALLTGAPTYASGPQFELTTPTGAAIVKTMATSFGLQPLMTVGAIGMGAGGKNFDDRPNVLRLFVGERSASLIGQRLIELSTNIDDMNPQAFPDVAGRLLAGGALDVWITPAQMKKGRPAHILSALCQPHQAQALEGIIFTHTTTLGVRRTEVDRVSLPRSIRQAQTRFGLIDVKIAQLPQGGFKAAPEYESVRKAALAAGAPFETVYWEAVAAVDSGGPGQV